MGASFLKGLAKASAPIVAATQSQEAEANSLTSHSLKRVYDLGMVKKSEANAVKQYEKLLRTNPAFARKEAIGMQNDFKTTIVGEDIPPRKIIKPDEFYNQTIAPVRGDMSYNAHYSMIDGLPVNVTAQGGHTHSRKFGGWASAEAIAKGQHDKLIDAQKQTGTDRVVAVYDNMGRESVNFSTPPVESMVQQLKLLDIPKEDINLFDNAVRDIKVRKKISKKGEPDKFKTTYPYKDWVGLDSPDVFNQLNGVNGFPQWGKLRTAVSKKMSDAKFRNKGFPSYEANINAFNDPALVNNALGTSGYSSYIADTSKQASKFSGHKSYDTEMHGSYLGGLEHQVPFDVMFPKTMANLSGLKTKAGKPYTRDQKIVAANIRKDGYEVADQQWLDGVEGFLERNRKAGGALLTGAGAAGGANASENQTAVSDVQAGADLASFEKQQNSLLNRAKRFLDSPMPNNDPRYDIARAMGEDVNEPNRAPRAMELANFLRKYSPDVPVLGQFLGIGAADYLEGLGYNKTVGEALGQSAFAALDTADLVGAGVLIKQAGKKVATSARRFHGTKDPIDKIDTSKLQFNDDGLIGTGFYSTSDPYVANTYAKKATARVEQKDGTLAGSNIIPLDIAEGKYKIYNQLDKQELGMAVRKDPSFAKNLTQQNIGDGYIGARMLDGKGQVVEQVNYFPNRDVENSITPFKL